MTDDPQVLENLNVLSREISRRQLMRAGGALGAAGLLGSLIAACSSSGGSPKSASSSGGSTSGSSASIAGTIDFLSYVAYDLKGTPMDQWRTQNHIGLKSTYISDQGEVTTKLSSPAGRGLYNLSSYSAQYGPFYKDLGILTPLDLSKIPNYQDALPIFKSGDLWSKYWHFDGQQWGIPFTWAYDTINYDSAKVAAPKGTNDMLSSTYKNKFAIADDLLGMILMAAQALGIANPEGQFTKGQLNQIVDFLKKLKKNARTVANGFGDIVNLYASGEIVANISGFAGMSVLVAQKGIKTVKSVLPEEGSLSFCDTYFIPAHAKDLDSVYAFINESLTPSMQNAEAGFLQAGVTTQKGVAALTPANKTFVPYNDITGLFKKAPLFGLPIKPPKGITSLSDWSTAWEEVKAS